MTGGDMAGFDAILEDGEDETPGEVVISETDPGGVGTRPFV